MFFLLPCSPLLECLLPWVENLLPEITGNPQSLEKVSKASTFSLLWSHLSTALLWRSFLPCALQLVCCQLSRNFYSISMQYSMSLPLYSSWILVEGGEIFVLFFVGRKDHFQCVPTEKDSPLCHFLCNTIKSPSSLLGCSGWRLIFYLFCFFIYFVSILSILNRLDYHLGGSGGKRGLWVSLTL